jgi:acetyltransferase-like isoleucine patch superfamily enzyme
MVWGYNNLVDGSYHPNVRISNTSFLYHPERINFSDDIFVWHYTILDGTGGLTIGTGTQIGAWVGVFTHSSHVAIRVLGANYRQFPEYEKPCFFIAPVEIGESVFIAAGSKILPGVKIGSYSLVSANSVVNQDIPPHSIVAGMPAKVVGSTKDMDIEAISKLDTNRMEFLDPDYLKILNGKIANDRG